MVIYTCDICGEDLSAGDGSVQHVDRYQIGVDLCKKHLEAWVDQGLRYLRTQVTLAPSTRHSLSRALMDAIVNEKAQPDPKAVAAYEALDEAARAKTPAPQLNLVLGIQALHAIVDDFTREQMAAQVTERSPRIPDLGVVSSEAGK